MAGRFTCSIIKKAEVTYIALLVIRANDIALNIHRLFETRIDLRLLIQHILDTLVLPVKRSFHIYTQTHDYVYTKNEAKRVHVKMLTACQ